ncbi:MAG: heme A synthase [Blastochloris sp.]|nr:heme A synthase [Blastochloris sp.]
MIARSETNPHIQALGLWLYSVALGILLMVLIGGATRLTGSGLSITEWQPIMGTIPPLSAEDWETAFDKYKQTPQFRISNPDMDMAGFKVIFFWEYLHRLWGRFLGILFALPLIVFAVKKQIGPALMLKLGLALLLGSAQGFLGWFMVQSGLVDKPWVSPYRLSAHLLLAVILFSWILWLACEQTLPGRSKLLPGGKSVAWLRWVMPLLFALLLLQIVWGGFMAGGRLAMSYPSFPTLNGQWLPPMLFQFESLWHHLCENPAAVHLIHRSLGTVLVLAVMLLWWKTRTCGFQGILGWARHGLLGLVCFQFYLGIMTVLGSVGRVPLVLGVVHQVTAVVLLGALLVFWHQSRRLTVDG